MLRWIGLVSIVTLVACGDVQDLGDNNAPLSGDSEGNATPAGDPPQTPGAGDNKTVGPSITREIVPATTPTPCTVEVPRDYAGLGAAVTALLPTGGKVCLRGVPQDSAPVKVTAVPAGTPPLEIEGYGREAPIANVDIEVDGYVPGLRIANIAVRSILVAESFVEIHRSRMTTERSAPLRVSQYYRKPTKVLVDGCDISATGEKLDSRGTPSRAVSVYLSQGPGELVRIQNSHIHGAGRGLMYSERIGEGLEPTIAIVNNTFSDNLVGIEFAARPLTDLRDDEPIVNASSTNDRRYANNVFLSNGTGVQIDDSQAVLGLLPANNGFFGNKTNFAGPLAPGDGFITTNPQFDMTKSPPEPTIGSSYVGKASTSFAPKTDYFGRVRSATPTLGAIEL